MLKHKSSDMPSAIGKVNSGFLSTLHRPNSQTRKSSGGTVSDSIYQTVSTSSLGRQECGGCGTAGDAPLQREQPQKGAVAILLDFWRPFSRPGYLLFVGGYIRRTQGLGLLAGSRSRFSGPCRSDEVDVDRSKSRVVPEHEAVALLFQVHKWWNLFLGLLAQEQQVPSKICCLE